MIFDYWSFSEEAAMAAQPCIDRLERTCPAFLAMQACRLAALARVHLPLFSRGESAFLARCLCGFGLPYADTVATADIAGMIADHIRETFIVEFGAEGLAEELHRFGHDREWRDRFDAMPENVFADRIENTLDPLQAYLLVFVIECYWQRKYYDDAAELSDFLILEEREEDGLRDYMPPE